MQVIEIEENLMAEICEAAIFEEKSWAEFINAALREALRKTENKRLEPKKIKRFIESYEEFSQELDESEEEWEHWNKVYEKSEQRSEK